MSPEIFQNKPYSYKSDVWALGCILYEMTTLNHAFDSSSLNGLAGKIVKGRYPPINPKYSQGLRDLVARQLLINPLQRPDMDQILRKSIVKKHIVNFLSDIMSRPVSSVGEGTMVLKAAADVFLSGEGGKNSVSEDLHGDSSCVDSLQKQLRELDLADLLSEAVAPRSQPKDPEAARRLAREQSSALQREQEHRQMVELALERLRQDREARATEKMPTHVTPGNSNARLLRPVPVVQPKALPPAIRVTALKQPLPTPSSSKDRLSIPSRPQSSQDQASSAADARRLNVRPLSRPPSQPLSARPQILPQIPARRRDSVSASATPREDSGSKPDQASARRREELSKKKLEEQRLEERQRLAQLAAAQAQIDLARELERQKQREEIAQLRRDKVELDRRTEERLRLIKVRSESKISAVPSSQPEVKSGDRPQKSVESKYNSAEGAGSLSAAAIEHSEAKTVSQARGPARASDPMTSPTASSKSTIDEEDPFFTKDAVKGVNGRDLEEDLRRKEAALQAELMMATARCQELRQTLKETKRFIGAGEPHSGQRSTNYSGSTTHPAISDDEEDFTGSYSESEFDDSPDSPANKASVTSGSRKRSEDLNSQQPAASSVSSKRSVSQKEAPSSSGRLTERIDRLRVKCVEGLGADTFRRAYRAVLEFEERLGEAQVDNELLEAEKERQLLAIVGEGRLHYMSLLEQLIFMEESHG